MTSAQSGVLADLVLGTLVGVHPDGSANIRPVAPLSLQDSAMRGTPNPKDSPINLLAIPFLAKTCPTPDPVREYADESTLPSQ